MCVKCLLVLSGKDCVGSSEPLNFTHIRMWNDLFI